MRSALAFVFALFAGLVARTPAQPTSVQSCVVIQELTAEQPRLSRGECDTRLSPASTFKIPHALVALETGVVTTSSVEKWNGRKYEQQVKWNRDHTVISALRPSVLWVFQAIAPRIGAKRMTGWLETFAYGNRRVAGAITEYWTNGTLTISPQEQVTFLRRFYRGQLPVRPEHVRVVREGLEQRQGTVENSLGVHVLDGGWRGATLNAKTGATTTGSYRVSWLVGLFRAENRDYVFASAVWDPRLRVDTLDATHLAVKTFIASGLLPSAPR